MVATLAASSGFVMAVWAETDADAQTDVDTSDWVTDAVPGTTISVKHPATWTKTSSDVLQRLQAQVQAKYGPASKDVTVVLAIAHVGIGDNVTVNRFAGKTAAYWYSGLGEYKKNAKYSADYSHGKVVSVAKAKVGRMPAYRHVETYTDPQAKQRIYYGELEIRPSKDAVLDVIVNVAVTTPNARRTVEAMLDGVTA
jgi:ribose 5-phosphate isomerase RpiB